MTAKNAKFENSFISTLINGFLYIKGPYSNLKMNGIIETSNGRIDYLGLGFNMLNAKIEIIDAMHGNEVYITAEGETTIFSKTRESETIKLIVDRSEISKISQDSIKFSLKDNSDMDSHEVLKKVTKTERNAKVNMRNDENILGFKIKQQVLRLVNQPLVTHFAKMILRKTGFIDDFKVSYVQPIAGVYGVEERSFINLFSGTKYSAEKKLINQILLRYSITFDEIDKKFDFRHEIGIIYKLTNDLFLIGNCEIDSVEQFHRPNRRLMLKYQTHF
jgi:hypothetical protein